MASDEDFDMYGDLLDDELTKPSDKKRQKTVEDTTEKDLALKILQDQLKSVQDELSELAKSKDQIEKNMSALLLTCRAEIER